MPATKLTDAQKIERVAQRNGWDFYPSYSGRGAFSARCPGIVCPTRSRKRRVRMVRVD